MYDIDVTLQRLLRELQTDTRQTTQLIVPVYKNKPLLSTDILVVDVESVALHALTGPTYATKF